MFLYFKINIEHMQEDESSDVTIGHSYSPESTSPTMGTDPTLREGTVVYNDVQIGDQFITGHNVLVREKTDIGDNVVVGTNSVIDGHSTIGSNVSMQTNVYVPKQTTIHDRVFIGPGAVLTNDTSPVREDVDLEGPTIMPDVSIGANATILPGVTIGERSFVAAGATVTSDVPPDTLAIGTPAEHRELPERLTGGNDL